MSRDTVAWKKGTTWKGHKTHMGRGQGAYGAECAEIARALRVAAIKYRTLGTVTIVTDAQAAIDQEDDLGRPRSGPKYAKHSRQGTKHSRQGTKHPHRNPVVP